ncbi:hypothetical protein B738_26527 [Photorhabdus temperata subsp. temperata M1021]|nr:hypothetical protein B738_26527 [Photorhabdus temperata subsp. temperata M1021]
MVVKVIAVWLKVRMCGKEKGPGGLQSLARIENTLYSAFFVMVFCCAPLMNVSLAPSGTMRPALKAAVPGPACQRKAVMRQ